MMSNDYNVCAFLKIFLSYIKYSIRFFIAPPFCAYCKEFLWHDVILCTSCKQKVHPIVSHVLPVTSTKSVRVFAISAYQDPMRRLILAKGMSNATIAYQLGHLLWQLTDIKTQQFDYIVPVPLHWKRYAWRGYNQAHEMAKTLNIHAQKSVLHALKRTKATVPQSMLTSFERMKNVEEVFVVRTSMAHKIKGARIVLVDDLMTSGSTLRACAKELYKCGAKEVLAVVVSRVI